MSEVRDEIQRHDVVGRWGRLEAEWDARFPSVDALLVKDGSDADSIKLKVMALQAWLLRREFSNSILVLGKTTLIILTSKERLALLEGLPDKAAAAGKRVVLLEKTPDAPAKDFERLFEATAAAGLAKFGGFAREKQGGAFIDAFEKELAVRGVTETDVSGAFQEFLSVKSPEDLELVGRCAKANVFLMKELIVKIENLLEDNASVSHAKITKSMENQIEKSRKTLEDSLGVRTKHLDYPYFPVVQSGKAFDLKVDAESNGDPLSQNYILLNLAVKYFELNTNIFRTLLVDPTAQDKTHYSALCKIHDFVISALGPGIRCADVYNRTVEMVRNTHPDLVAALPANFGFGIGYEFREACLLLNAKNEKGELHEGQVMVVVTSLKDLKGRNDQLYSIHLSDTVQITSTSHINLTSGVSKRLDDIGYLLEGNDSHEAKPAKNHKASSTPKPDLTEVDFSGPMAARTRTAQRMEELKKEQNKLKRMKQHQKELLNIKMQELEERVASGTFASKASESSKINLEKLKAYTPENFPVKANPRNILVDVKRNSVLLPINGQLVPFHVSCLKNVTKHAEAKVATLRFNFFTPGISAGNIIFPNPEHFGGPLVYVKELTFRSHNVENYNQIAKDIKEVQKNLKQSLNGTAEAANEKLSLANKLKFLNDIKMRPAMNGRKTAGQLTAYENGFRFTNKSTSENFDLALGNIRHAVLQPCDQDLIVIIHFALKEKVVINKKDYHHVQFYTEVGLLTEDLNDPRRRNRGHDYDEFEEEELERQAKEYYNKQFIEFCGYVEKHWKSTLKFDSPFFESGFHGSHAYNNVTILPTSHCFVSLVEQPFLVVAYSDIELVSLERIDNKIKNFDMIVVFKDYTRPVQTITNIPKNKLDMLKAWLEWANQQPEHPLPGGRHHEHQVGKPPQKDPGRPRDLHPRGKRLARLFLGLGPGRRGRRVGG